MNYQAFYYQNECHTLMTLIDRDNYQTLESLNKTQIFTQGQVLKIVGKIYEALKRIHRDYITHGNLTLANIFVDSVTLNVKIGDYGNQ